MIGGETSVEKVLEEHRELRHMIRELNRFLERPQPELTEADSHIWAGDLAERFVRLHRKLFLHFRRENHSGILKELAETFPWATRTVQSLQDDHNQFLDDIRQIVADTMICVEGRLPTALDLRGRALRLLKQLIRHEEAETDLIQRLYCEDRGGGGG